MRSIIRLRVVVGAGAVATLIGVATGGPALAVGNPPATGQPNQSCQAEPSSPGNAASAPGSAFNEQPGGTAGTVYAGTQPQNSKNLASVSQYDVACYQVSQH